MSPAEQTQDIQKLDKRILILAAGRFVSMIGSGFTAFYAPIFFVNVVHISATLVGVGLAANSVAGAIARVLGGSLSDLPKCGRRMTLLISSVILAIGSLIMGLVHDFEWFFIGNTLIGFGIGFYWPGAEAMIADLTTDSNRRDAYAINRFADYGGLGIGVIIAGLIVQSTGAYRLLFFVDAASYAILAAVICFGIQESQHAKLSAPLLQSWGKALRDPLLQLYAIANILMTAYIIQISSSLPLYLTDKIKLAEGKSMNPIWLSGLFAVHVLVVALSQIPIAKAMNRFSPAKSLVISCGVWFLGFLLVGLAGMVLEFQFALATLALIVMSLATVAYGPPSSALIVELAPKESRAIYFSINSLCWAMGGLVGPPLVFAAMDQFPQKTAYIWIVVAFTTVFPALVFGLIAAKESTLAAKHLSD